MVNLGLEAEYFINKKLGIFVSGDNLTGSKLYPFAHYRGLEANVNIGIKLLF